MPSFADLPVELRLQIYDYHQPRNYINCREPLGRPWSFPLCQLNSKLRKEALEHYFSSREMRANLEFLRFNIEWINPSVRGLIKRLRLWGITLKLELGRHAAIDNDVRCFRTNPGGLGAEMVEHCQQYLPHLSCVEQLSLVLGITPGIFEEDTHFELDLADLLRPMPLKRMCWAYDEGVHTDHSTKTQRRLFTILRAQTMLELGMDPEASSVADMIGEGHDCALLGFRTACKP